MALEVEDWKKIAYTDGSCIRDQQIIGAGRLVNPHGSSITKTVQRAELAGIAAAVTHDY